MATAVERPRARTEGLVIKALPDEVLVHDLARHRTHCLNGPAAAVWRLCDGQRTPGEIARQLGQAPEARWSDEAVRLALDDLGRAHLLTDVLTGRPDAGGVTRRQMLQRLAAGCRRRAHRGDNRRASSGTGAVLYSQRRIVFPQYSRAAQA